MIYSDDLIFAHLANGAHLGTAYFQAKRESEEAMCREYTDGTVIAGYLLIGEEYVEM